jgi:hypothetical protein
MIEAPRSQQDWDRMAVKQLADRNGRRLDGVAEFRRLDHARADEADGSYQQPEHIGNAPSQIDELLMRQQRRQREAEQRDDDRDDAGAGPLPARTVTLAIAGMLHEKSHGTAEFAPDRESLKKTCDRDDERRRDADRGIAGCSHHQRRADHHQRNRQCQSGFAPGAVSIGANHGGT